nr:putative ribonuclease H-like domain-containing protein [Tanacetum cinerariifolium]
MNYEPVTAGNQTNYDAGIEKHDNAGQAGQEKTFDHEYILLPFMPSNSLPLSLSTQSSDDKDVDEVPGKGDEGVSKGSGIDDQERTDSSIDYDEVFAHVTRMEAIRLFLAYASFMGFIVYQIDEKSAFLYGIIEEEVYVCQPPGFEDPHFPNKVYKVEKALYGLHQAPRAWYETLFTYLLENGLKRGTIDKNLFIKKDRGDILLVQVYVDDIIFGFTNKSLCDEFELMMHKRFQMSSMGELTFFLGLQVKQKDDGIFIGQDKYVAKILKKFDFTTMKTASTLMKHNRALIKDAEAKDVPSYTKDFTPSCCKENLQILKIDYAKASLDMKSTTGGCQFLGKKLISWQCKKKTIVANSTTKAELRAMDVNGMDLIAYLFLLLHWVLNLMVFAYGRMVYVVMGGRRMCFSDTSTVVFVMKVEYGNRCMDLTHSNLSKRNQSYNNSSNRW